MKKSKNYQILIGIIIGLFLSGQTGYAVTNYIGSGKDATYDNRKSGLTSTNMQDALDELYIKKCPSNYVCLKQKNNLALGDYISLTPTKSSYTTNTNMTGYTSTQTINPQELNLWRVIRLNTNGTVDVISEYVSSTTIYFSGLTGYKNFIGYLNVLATQYENSTYTIGSRYFGYNGQTEYITDTSMFKNPAPWTTSTGSTTVESQGGGDTLLNTDLILANTTLGTLLATNSNGTISDYWIASRFYYYNNGNDYLWSGRYINKTGETRDYNLYANNNAAFYTRTNQSALRPILTLKANLSYFGVGSKEYPIEIKSNN